MNHESYGPALESLQQVANVYPTLRGVMNVRNKDGSHVGQLWAAQLARYPQDIVSDICDEIACFEREPVPRDTPMDRFAFYLIEAVKARASSRREKLEQYEKYHKPCEEKRARKLERLGWLASTARGKDE